MAKYREKHAKEFTEKGVYSITRKAVEVGRDAWKKVELAVGI